MGEIMSNTLVTSKTGAPIGDDPDSAFRSTTDTDVLAVDLSKLPVPVTAIVAARLGVPAPSRVVPAQESTPDYSDGYGGTYSKGE